MDGIRVKSDDQTERARELRQLAIDAEKKLWYLLKAGNAVGFKVQRQHPLGPYFLDYYCFKAKLALEIDGSSHEGREEYDACRDAYCLARGVKTLRFSPKVADEDIEYFVTWFREECEKRVEELKK